MHTFSSKPSGKRGHAALQSGGYAAHREAAQRQTDQSLAGRDIGELPEVADPERKEACRTDFRRFCEIYDEPEKVVDRHASSTESTMAECAEERSSKGRCRRHGVAARKGPREMNAERQSRDTCAWLMPNMSPISCLFLYVPDESISIIFRARARRTMIGTFSGLTRLPSSSLAINIFRSATDRRSQSM